MTMINKIQIKKKKKRIIKSLVLKVVIVVVALEVELFSVYVVALLK